jgi:tetratricopeptide (TPR) repeat protein
MNLKFKSINRLFINLSSLMLFHAIFPSWNLAQTATVTPLPTLSESENSRRADELWERGNDLARKGYENKADEYWGAAEKLDASVTERLSKAAPLAADTETQKRVDELISKAEESCDKKDFSLALKYADAVESISPHEPRVAAIRERVTLEDYRSDPDRPYDSMVKNLFDKAVNEFRNQNYSRALETVDQALEVNEENQQLKDLKTLIESKNSDVQAEKDTTRAEGLFEEGDMQGASEVIETVLQDNPNYEPALELKKKIEDSVGKEKMKQSQDDLEAATQKEKDGQYLVAKKYYEKALQEDPGNEEAEKGLQRVRTLVDPVEGELAELEKTVRMGDKPTAEKLVLEIEKIDPQTPGLKKLKEKVEAMSAPNSDSEAKADEAYNLGLQSYRNNDLVSAKKFWSDALELNPRHEQARRNLNRLLDEHPELKDQ